MSGKKYKIEQDGQFLGHWCSVSPEGAIQKMLNSTYATIYNVNPHGSFDIQYGSKEFHIIGEK